MCREIEEIEELFETLENITMNNEYVNQIVTKTKNKAMTKLKEVHLPDVIPVSYAENKVARNHGYKDWEDLQADYNGVHEVYAWDLLGMYKEVIDILHKK